ncbi:putative Flocculation protein FLO11 [Streptomyces afghaniensis 772]|uniref:Putative Flocculation protein FLO11 n=1 Tax=Streptomyces afghaniensis 772 TaxID=1283301 RepID=S4MX01_9ACTN|nr:PD40 domain-containing protein [Streptomyces afghaniensis]EPJ40420.1 putative Flocculation protein FLO11 [Streptomyces afghaniensis 772]
MTSTTRVTSGALGVALAVTLGGLAALPASAAPEAPRTEKASVAPDGAEGNGDSGGPSLSADGRRLAFVSSADNLVAGDTDGAADAFVRDLRTGTTRLASTGADVGPVDDVALSGNGRYLAFGATGTGDGRSHIWVKDLKSGALQRIEDTVDTGYDSGRRPALSADGRYVAFIAQRSDLTPSDDGWGRVYRVDRTTGEAVRVSQVPAAGDRKTAATNPSISADGKRVGYQFFIPHPAPGDWSDAYVRDVPSGELFHADRAPDGVKSDGQTEFPQVSADGRYALFNSLDSRLTPGDTNKGHNVFVRDLRTGELRRIDAADPAAFTANPQLSADNRYLAFVSADPGDTHHTTRAYVRDLRTGRTVLASPDAQGGPNDQGVSAPVIDRHGRRLAFSSSAPDLVPGDTYDTSHVYVRHLK